MTDNATVVMEDLRNTGGDKYETTAREIQICRFSTFCSKWRMTFRKVTPAALKVNVKNSDKFYLFLGMCEHQFGCILPHGGPSSQWKIDSPIFFRSQGSCHSWLWFSQSSWLDYRPLDLETTRPPIWGGFETPVFVTFVSLRFVLGRICISDAQPRWSLRRS